MIDQVAALTADPVLSALLADAASGLAPPVPPTVETASAPPLSPPARDQRTAVVVGPGVVRARRVENLGTFAAATGLAVVNTWGAKGVFRWDEPHHGGTAGLQRDDFALAGVDDADVVITSGLDPDECPALLLDRDRTVDVDPHHLGAAAQGWPTPPTPPVRPVLYERLAAVVGPMYTSEADPPPPPRVVSALAGRGLVAADSGPAGFWVARTFPTTAPGSVLIPARDRPGWAAAVAVAAATITARSGAGSGPYGPYGDRYMPQKRGAGVVAVTTAPLDDETTELLALARAAGLAVTVQVWTDPEAAPPPPVGEGVAVEPVVVDWSAIDALVAVAGPVVAWESDPQPAPVTPTGQETPVPPRPQ